MHWQDDILNLPYRPERVYDDFWKKVKEAAGIGPISLEDCLKIAIINQLTNEEKWSRVYKNYEGAPSKPYLFYKCADFFDQVRMALNKPKLKFISKKECFRIAVKEQTFGRRAWRRIYKNYKNTPSDPSATYNDPNFFKKVKERVEKTSSKRMTPAQRAVVCKEFYNKTRQLSNMLQGKVL